MLLVVDNGSIYTNNLLDFLLKKKITHTSLTHEQISEKEFSDFEMFILSGRRKNNQNMNAINSKIIKHCINNSKPLLGICYGAEILALTLGGTIRKSSIQKGDELVQSIEKNVLIDESISVFESHNYEISRLGYSLDVLASSKNCKHELIQFKNLPIFGTQFHPEMSADGQKLIERFCSF